MPTGQSVLLIGLEPTLIDFSAPEFAAFPDLLEYQAGDTAEAVQRWI